jgi:6-phosphogluconate dehydrogenase
MKTSYSLGILGLGVMGRSLAQNFARNGFLPIGFDLKPNLPENFIVKVVTSLQELTAALVPPRVLFLMVPAGAPVDAAIASLKPYLQAGDLIIDGGNSFFLDTERRVKELAKDGLYFIGMGVPCGDQA